MAFAILNGSQAAATAVQRAGVDLVVAYPITPQTAIVGALADFAAKGTLRGEFLSVESEYAALACCKGASAAGARTFTATASHGLAYMHEMIHWCSGGRFPIVLVNVNRTIGAPWCLDPDQGDSLSQRDTGWLQIYCANAQEVFDTVLQAFLLAEELLLPCMVVFDGFYISHTYEAVDLPEEAAVKRLIGPPTFNPQVIPGRPANLHGMSTGESQLRLVKGRHEAMLDAFRVFEEINRRYFKLFGRSYRVIDTQIPEKSKRAIITAGATAETVRWSLPKLKDTALVQLRMFRPFPAAEICAIVEEHQFQEIIVVDRNCSIGMGGIFAQEVRSALYPLANPPVVNNLILAGGVDLTEEMLIQATAAAAGEERNIVRWGDQFC